MHLTDFKQRSTMNSPHCKEFIEINHETFHCIVYANFHDHEHVWEGGIWPPCKECAGLDLHRENCSRLHKDHGSFFNWSSIEIRWRTGEKPRIKRKAN